MLFRSLLVLTVTSLNAVVRRMGARAWKNLHRLAYVAAALAAWHQADARKVFPLQVVWIFGPVVLLQIARHWRERRTPELRWFPCSHFTLTQRAFRLRCGCVLPRTTLPWTKRRSA